MIEEYLKKSFSVDGIRFKNFSELDDSESLEVLKMRNHILIRKNMSHSSEIDINNHLEFVKSLKNKKDKGYWLLIDSNNNLIGVITFSVLKDDIAEIGNYVNPIFLNKGLGILLNYYTQKIGFEKIGFSKLTAYVKKTNKEALKIHNILHRNMIGNRIMNGEQYLDISFDKCTWEKSKKSVEKLLEYIEF